MTGQEIEILVGWIKESSERWSKLYLREAVEAVLREGWIDEEWLVEHGYGE